MVRLGTSGWSYKSWVGVFYPDGTAPTPPPGFVFAAKVPQLITHEKRLQGCEAEVGLFLERIRRYQGSGASIFAFANNRYQGHAPATVRSLVAARGSGASAGPPPLDFRQHGRSQVFPAPEAGE